LLIKVVESSTKVNWIFIMNKFPSISVIAY
jgi:hypothetical protein